MITNYDHNCICCGRPTTTIHHLVFGRGLRELADEDGLTAPVCDDCHNMNGKMSIHGNNTSAMLSKIAGQLYYELNYVADRAQIPFTDVKEDARESFRIRYGKSYL